MSRLALGSRRWLAVPVLILAVAFVRPAAAQLSCSATTPTNAPTCNVALTTSVTVPHLLQLSTNVSTTALQQPGVPQYDSTNVAATNNEQPWGATGPVITIKANRPWTLTISAQTATWSHTPDSYNVTRATGKPAADLFWSTALASGYNALSTTGATVVSNVTGSTNTYQIYYRAAWRYASDVPGAYSINVVYTVTGN